MNGPSVAPRTLLLVGDPVAHSLSPRFQNAALEAAGLEATYTARRVDAAELPTFVDEVRARGLAGNVTVPHKEAFARLCDMLTPLARRVGAVNTYWCNDAHVVGDNTDVPGVYAALLHLSGGGRLKGMRACVLGAGGSAAAAVTTLVDAGVANVNVWARTRERANALQQRMGDVVTIVDEPAAAVDAADLVVNATPIGLHDDAMPIPAALLQRDTIVLDMVYRTGGTAFVRAARARGMRADDGLRMLVEQGAFAFERWFGFEPDRSVMWHALGESRK